MFDRKKGKTALELIFISLVLIIIACTRLIFWNPAVDGMVVRKSLSVNYKNVGIKINGFGLINSYRDPTLIMEIRNFDSLKTVSLDPNNIKVIIFADTLAPDIDSGSIIKLASNQKKKYVLSFKYSFTTKTEFGFYERKLPEIIKLKISDIRLDGKIINLPIIEFHKPGDRFIK